MSRQRFTQRIRQGDVTDTFLMSPFPGGDGGASNLGNTAYTCRSIVVAALGDAPLVDVTITRTDSATNMYFGVALEPADTNGLAAGNYLWITEIYNASTDPIYRKETHIDLVVMPQGVTP